MNFGIKSAWKDSASQNEGLCLCQSAVEYRWIEGAGCDWDWDWGDDGDMLVEDECKSWLLMNNDVALCRRRPSVGRCRH